MASPSEKSSENRVVLVMEKVWELEAPPPGVGLNTVICAVPALAILEAGIRAVN